MAGSLADAEKTARQAIDVGCRVIGDRSRGTLVADESVEHAELALVEGVGHGDIALQVEKISFLRIHILQQILARSLDFEDDIWCYFERFALKITPELCLSTDI